MMPARYPRKSIIAVLLLVAGFAVGPGLVAAHQGASGIVKERMDAMKAIADATKALSQMIRGQAAFDATRAVAAAATIESHADDFDRLFPEGSTDHPSEALPAIWQDWEAFSELADELVQGAADLAASAGDGPDGIRPSFAVVAGTCKSCHERFRLPR